MHLNLIDSLIVGIYLIATITVGFIAGRKIKTMRDFSVASKSFPTAVLVSTIFATWMGGDDLIGVSERIYSEGIIFLIIFCAQTISLFIHAYIIAPRIIRKFSDKISIGEIMGSLYGKPGQVLCGLANMMFSVGYVAVQVSAIGFICNVFFGIPHGYGAVIGSIIVITYSSFGGIRSVVFTDVLQFGILIVGIPLMASVALNEVGGWNYLVSHLPQKYLDIGASHESFELYILFFIVCAFPYFNPILIQRILMAKDSRQATESLAISGILYIPFYVVMTVIGLCAVILFPGIDPNNAFLSVLNHSLPPIVKGIAISGALAVIMSTADSFLNVSVIAAVRDVAGVLCTEKMTDKWELRLSKIVTVAFGFSSIYIATMFHSMIDFWLYFSNFWAPTVIAPMMLYLCHFRTDIKTYLYSLSLGLISIVVYRYSVPEDFNIASQLFGTFITTISMVIIGSLKNKNCYACKLN